MTGRTATILYRISEPVWAGVRRALCAICVGARPIQQCERRPPSRSHPPQKEQPAKRARHKAPMVGYRIAGCVSHS